MRNGPIVRHEPHAHIPQTGKKSHRINVLRSLSQLGPLIKDVGSGATGFRGRQEIRNAGPMRGACSILPALHNGYFRFGNKEHEGTRTYTHTPPDIHLSVGKGSDVVMEVQLEWKDNSCLVLELAGGRREAQRFFCWMPDQSRSAKSSPLREVPGPRDDDKTRSR